ncbi:MAG: hypothetical protein M1823_003443 [Watsoniomyces obsoletus]|nr:MAG: hypothetical protein M1823_003443 [Watsoniomyces obsoletus]
MQALLRQTASLSSRSRFTSCGSCRLIAGRRYPYRLRPARFHTSPIIRQSQDDPAPPGSVDKAEVAEEGANETSTLPTTESEVSGNTEEGGSSERTGKVKDLVGNYGSAMRRSARNRRPKELPPVEIPEWFLKHNVRLHDEVGQEGEQLKILEAMIQPAAENLEEKTAKATTVAASIPAPKVPPPAEKTEEKVAETRAETSEESASITAPTVVERDTDNASPDASPRYQLHENIWNEILANIRSGLALPTSHYANHFPAHKVHLVLQCPKDGGIYFLDAVVDKAAAAVGADLLRLDAQDLAESFGNYLGEGPDPSPYSLRSMAYEVHQLATKQDARDAEEAAEEEEEMEAAAEEEPQPTMRGLPTTSKVTAVPIRAIFGTLEDLLKSGKLPVSNVTMGGAVPRSGNSVSTISRTNSQSSEQWEDMKLSGMASAILDTIEMKMHPATTEAAASAETSETPTPETSTSTEPVPANAILERPLIVQIRDFKEMQATANGGLVVRAILNQIRRRRKTGQAIVLVATVSSADFVPSLSRSGIRNLQSEWEDGPGRTIVVTPPRSTMSDNILSEDEKRRTREINMRHLQDMLLQRAPSSIKATTVLPQTDLRLDSSVEYSSGLEDSVWSFDRVHRVAVTALGLVKSGEELTPATISQALQLLDRSDETKFQWAVEEAQTQQAADAAEVATSRSTPAVTGSVANSEARLKKIRKNCNAHEKKLLAGVINPENIRTTFADVHATSDTITALKTLTSLSLIRPEAFSYGVLATDHIPGLLLYGPPGTGKTLLAKAVAKESGATVLEVSGSEVYDMFVGEGEKNVKAIFTLARKLSPCVVFIDEADAIFASRSGQGNRTSHRELINQFLREWDGMNDLSAFIMVATNRPFDLDDAVLRRLPRRLLVDLPVEKDREAILRIHLKDEILDPSVSLPDLAKRTTFYSGSDLKNLSVAAALACVREESDEAAKYTETQKQKQTEVNAADEAKPIPYQYPERRTLTKHHFEKAMEEIPASISEDMSSLAAIRKFDEKYGDRKGRRKKSAGWGFGSAVDAETVLETGRVRN